MKYMKGAFLALVIAIVLLATNQTLTRGNIQSLTPLWFARRIPQVLLLLLRFHRRKRRFIELEIKVQS
jgi:hypothetical protein